MSASGARVDVYAIDICDELTAGGGSAARRDRHHRCTWSAENFEGAAIAVGAFEDDQGAAEFAAAARTAGVPVNVIDKPAFCDFSFGAIVNRSPLVIGISTDGAAPVFAQAIRAKLEALLPSGFAGWAAAAARWRSAVKASAVIFRRRKFWDLFTAQAVTNPNHEPVRPISRLHCRGEGAWDSGRKRIGNAGWSRTGDPELLTCAPSARCSQPT